MINLVLTILFLAGGCGVVYWAMGPPESGRGWD